MRFVSPLLGGRRGLAHGFFGRRGGVSRGLFESLNVSFRNGDHPEDVAENRRRVAAALGGGRLVIARQVHGAHCEPVETAWDPAVPVEADALATCEPGLILGVTTADCVPVLLADPEAGVVAAAHAGWRGALKGIVESTLGRMGELGARPERTLAAIGPCIAWKSYEIGPDLEAAFLEADPGNSRYFEDRRGRRHFDLPGFLAGRLARAGVVGVDRIARDTFAEAPIFFSYRRACRQGQKRFGVQVAAIRLLG